MRMIRIRWSRGAFVVSVTVLALLTPLMTSVGATSDNEPTTTGQCKADGWRDFPQQFKNQGQCVSFVAAGGKHGRSESIRALTLNVLHGLFCAPGDRLLPGG